MKRLSAVLLIVILAFGLMAVSVADSVKVHDGKDAYLFDQNGNIRGSAKAGEEYELLEESDAWFRIRLENGSEGWIATDTAEVVNDGSEWVYSADDLLRNGVPDAKIKISDDLSAYTPDNNELYELTKGLNVVILEREAPLKEFSSFKFYPPFDESAGLPENFSGIDIGSPQVWLRGDLMNRIPSYYRASSIKDATYLIIIESYYEICGSISVTDFSSADDGDIPVCESPEELKLYCATHEKEVTSITYYPKFAAYVFISIYDTETKDFSFFDLTYTPAMRFARNPEASDQWDNMYELYNLLYYLDEESGLNVQEAKNVIDYAEFVPQNKKDLWISCIDAEEYSTACHSISEYFWSMANELKELDPSEDNRQNYEMLIDQKDIDTCVMFANLCDYSGFDRSVESIEMSRDYIADPDYEGLENAIEETIAVFN